MKNREIVRDEIGKTAAGWVMQDFVGYDQDWSRRLMWFGQRITLATLFIIADRVSWGWMGETN